MHLKTYGLINEVFLLGDDIDRQLFSRFSLTVRQYHLLNWLDIRGQASLSELAQLLLCDNSNVTGIVRRLVAANLIEKRPSVDRRFTMVALTDEGKRIHAEAHAALAQSIAARFQSVPDSEHEQLQQLLTQMYGRLHAYLDRRDHADKSDNQNPVDEEVMHNQQS